MQIKQNEFLWVEKYRPKTVDDCILPDSMKATFQAFVDQKQIPNLLLSGMPGTGKTTIARALCDEIDLSYLLINGSKDRGIDVLRNQITSFASTVSFKGGRKAIIIDEADGLTDMAQAALRASIEEFSQNATFVLTCNYPAKLIDAIHSRCIGIQFNWAPQERPALASKIMKRVINILKEEECEYTKPAIASLVNRYFPDFRRIITELQRYAAVDGLSDETTLGRLLNGQVNVLYKAMKEKKWTDVMKWLKLNQESNDHVSFFTKIYDDMEIYLKPESRPQAVIHIGKYQYQASFVSNQEINNLSCLTEIMKDCEFL